MQSTNHTICYTHQHLYRQIHSKPAPVKVSTTQRPTIIMTKRPRHTTKPKDMLPNNEIMSTPIPKTPINPEYRQKAEAAAHAAQELYNKTVAQRKQLVQVIKTTKKIEEYSEPLQVTRKRIPISDLTRQHEEPKQTCNPNLTAKSPLPQTEQPTYTTYTNIHNVSLLKRNQAYGVLFNGKTFYALPEGSNPDSVKKENGIFICTNSTTSYSLVPDSAYMRWEPLPYKQSSVDEQSLIQQQSANSLIASEALARNAFIGTKTEARGSLTRQQLEATTALTTTRAAAQTFLSQELDLKALVTAETQARDSLTRQQLEATTALTTTRAAARTLLSQELDRKALVTAESQARDSLTSQEVEQRAALTTTRAATTPPKKPSLLAGWELKNIPLAIWSTQQDEAEKRKQFCAEEAQRWQTLIALEKTERRNRERWIWHRKYEQEQLIRKEDEARLQVMKSEEAERQQLKKTELDSQWKPRSNEKERKKRETTDLNNLLEAAIDRTQITRDEALERADLQTRYKTENASHLAGTVCTLLRQGNNPSEIAAFLHKAIIDRSDRLKPDHPEDQALLPLLVSIHNLNNLFYTRSRPIYNPGTDAITKLLQLGADPLKPFHTEVSMPPLNALERAVLAKNEQATELLLKHIHPETYAVNSKRHAPNPERSRLTQRALQIACCTSQDEIVRQFCLHADVDINAHDPVTGMTPLHYAALYRNINIANYLTQAGADPSQTDHNGKTPFDYLTLEPEESQSPMFQALPRPPQDPIPANEFDQYKKAFQSFRLPTLEQVKNWEKKHLTFVHVRTDSHNMLQNSLDQMLSPYVLTAHEQQVDPSALHRRIVRAAFEWSTSTPSLEGTEPLFNPCLGLSPLKDGIDIPAYQFPEVSRWLAQAYQTTRLKSPIYVHNAVTESELDLFNSIVSTYTPIIDPFYEIRPDTQKHVVHSTDKTPSGIFIGNFFFKNPQPREISEEDFRHVQGDLRGCSTEEDVLEAIALFQLPICLSDSLRGSIFWKELIDLASYYFPGGLLPKSLQAPQEVSDLSAAREDWKILINMIKLYHNAQLARDAEAKRAAFERMHPKALDAAFSYYNEYDYKEPGFLFNRILTAIKRETT